MKRSEINRAVRDASAAFKRHGWALPPKPRWDVTDFGLGNFPRWGLVLVNLAEQPEYCEKIMFVRHAQVTPRHHHAAKKEDIICRWGRLAVRLFTKRGKARVQINGEWREVPAGRPLLLKAGERITMRRRLPHAFWADSRYAILGEVSTRNDDKADNFFKDRRIGRFSAIEKDEARIVRLVGAGAGRAGKTARRQA